MVTRLFLFPLLLAAVVVSLPAVAQVEVYLTPLDVPTDARSAGLGESLVAVRSDPSALMYNPAGLSGLRGYGLSYGERDFAWMPLLEDFRYYGIDAFAETPVGVFALRYERFSEGQFSVITSLSPETGGVESHFSHAVTLGFGREITSGLDFGVAVKYYNDVYQEISRINPAVPLDFPSTTPAWLFDGGLLYTVPGIFGPGNQDDLLTMGIAIQNVGTKVQYGIQTESETVKQSLPTYLRAGIASTFRFLPEGEERVPLIVSSLTLEYSHVLDAGQIPTDDKSSWGAGLDITIAGILSLRGGMVIRGVTSIYGESGSAAYRYGTGVHLPFERLGVPIPLVISAEYAALPLHDVGLELLGAQRHTLDVFSFGVKMQ